MSAPRGRLRRLAGALSEADRDRLDAAPIDVVLTRAAGEAGDRFHDEERVLDRELWLPAARDFTVGGLAAAGPGLPDPVVDRLAGASGKVVAGSSSRFFDEVGARAGTIGYEILTGLGRRYARSYRGGDA